jgi:uncharacterized protein YndB with AHSA1/START domain
MLRRMPGTDRTDVTPQGDHGVRLQRVFAAPPDVVWDAMTDPALIPRWWGPAHHAPCVVEMDLRPGGRWRFEMDAHGTIFGFGGEYLEVERPGRLVQTFVFDPYPDAGAREEITLAPHANGHALLTVDITHPTPEGRDAQLSGGIAEGMQETHRRLAVLVAERMS